MKASLGKRVLAAAWVAALVTAISSACISVAYAHGDKAKTADEKHRQDDTAKHRAMAQAHEAAAKCLEAGKKYDVCAADLRKSCEGLGIGRYCGMKH